MEKVSNKLAMYMGQIYDKNKLDISNCMLDKIQVNREIKTIGLFYHRYRNGGVERVMSLRMPMFQEMGYKVVLITEEDPTNDDYYIPNGVDRYTICDTWKVVDGNISYEKRVEQFVDIIERSNIDVMVYEALMSPLAYWDIVTINKCGVYSVGCSHNLFSQEIVFLKHINKQLNTYRLLDKMLVLSETEAAYWKIYGIDATYIFNPKMENIEVVDFDKRKDIVWVGRLDAIQKRYIDIVDIMKNVVLHCPEASMRIYGKGTAFEENTLRQIIAENGLDNNIALAGYTTDVNEIYKTAKVHLVTSVFEAFPMAMFESRCAGIPLVTYEMPYLELLTGKGGYISVPDGDYSSAAEAIVRILTDGEMQRELSKKACESVEFFTMETLKNKWMQVFFELSKQNVNYIDSDVRATTILDTIYKHVHIAERKYNTLKDMYKDLLDEKMLERVKLANSQGKGVVIYPYGKEAKRIERYLREHDIRVDYVIDKYATDESIKIRRLFELEGEDTSKYLYIISGCNLMHYDEIRNSIMQYVEKDNIYDAFPRELITRSVMEGLMLW